MTNTAVHDASDVIEHEADARTGTDENGRAGQPGQGFRDLKGIPSFAFLV